MTSTVYCCQLQVHPGPLKHRFGGRRMMALRCFPEQISAWGTSPATSATEFFPFTKFRFPRTAFHGWDFILGESFLLSQKSGRFLVSVLPSSKTSYLPASISLPNFTLSLCSAFLFLWRVDEVQRMMAINSPRMLCCLEIVSAQRNQPTTF